MLSVVQNKTLHIPATSWQEEVDKHFSETNEKARKLEKFQLAARSWDHSRRITAKIERTAKDRNTR